ncbi:hypothetical protein NKH36_03355 [Mesorhizobium sp. M1312]|uniref:hypothetical protein n=1 Tax=unclassified Mesorhizobium TaxID=325217 RepID=UPI00333649B1
MLNSDQLKNRGFADADIAYRIVRLAGQRACAAAHVAALEKASQLGFDIFIVSAPTPFRPDDCQALIADAPSVVARYFPEFPALYVRKGWTMFSSIDRVYDASTARDRLGFVCKTSFADVLAALAAEEGAA